MAAIRHRPPRLPAVPWINYLRVPAGLSGLLLLIWFPLILRLRTQYHASTTLSPDPFLWHWLAVTGALFLLSAMLALRLRAVRRDDEWSQRPARNPSVPLRKKSLPIRSGRSLPTIPVKPRLVRHRTVLTFTRASSRPGVQRPGRHRPSRDHPARRGPIRRARSGHDAVRRGRGWPVGPGLLPRHLVSAPQHRLGRLPGATASASDRTGHQAGRDQPAETRPRH